MITLLICFILPFVLAFIAAKIIMKICNTLSVKLIDYVFGIPKRIWNRIKDKRKATKNLPEAKEVE